MHKVFSKALGRSIETDRVIGHIKGDASGPTIIFTAGIHGNEPSGVFALHDIFSTLEKENIKVKGSIYGIAGNLWALEKGVRYEQNDLNRLWKGEDMRLLEEGLLEPKNEDVIQQIEIYSFLKDIIEKENGPFYFLDLHTTSSKTIPFLTVNDSLLNRKFTKNYPVPIILGIEEYLDGPLLSYINKLGYVAFGYEGGQHDDLAAFENHVAFIYLTLVIAGAVNKNEIDFNRYQTQLAQYALGKRNFYEIFHYHKILEGETFQMNPGYVNFQTIKKGDRIAISNGAPVEVKKSSLIFMPLYQSQGSDGYFLVRGISPFFLRLSALVRKTKLDYVFALLPGVKWASKDRQALVVNRRIARLFTKQIFHLLGYRSRELNEDKYYMRNREAISRTKEYKSAPWI